MPLGHPALFRPEGPVDPQAPPDGGSRVQPLGPGHEVPVRGDVQELRRLVQAPERELPRIALSAAVVMARRGDGDPAPAIRRAREALRDAQQLGTRQVILCEAA